MPPVELTLPPFAHPGPSRFFRRASRQLRDRLPRAVGRVEARWLTQDELGLELVDELLPLSARAGVLPAALLTLVLAVTP